MSRNLRIAMAQIDPVLGDLKGNAGKILDYMNQAIEQKAEMVIFPELAVIGYSPQDLLFDHGFIHENIRYLNEIAAQMPHGILAIIGFVDMTTKGLHNSVAIMEGGKVLARRYKTLLPNYDVFDENRYFVATEFNVPVELEINGKKFNLGVEICEDLWDSNSDIKVTDSLVSQGADLIVNISASPFEYNKRDVRKNLVFDKVRNLKKPFILVNLIGGQDEMVFDGNSLAVGADGQLIGWGNEFVESLSLFDIDLDSGVGIPLKLPEIQREASIFNALVLGVKDYFRKTGCYQAVLGLSGGIDSALVAVIATEALGAENVTCVSLPSRFTALISIEDAQLLSKNLNVKYLTIPIDPIVESFGYELNDFFSSMKRDVTEENIQSRVRGTLLMALSNKFNSYLLSTGNKTELALGYCTMYGDMCGALAVISDLSKSDVYAVSRYINESRGELIPKRIFERIPTAELAEGQFDPFDYKLVSPLVDYIINDQKSKSELIEMGFEKSLVDEIFKKIKLSEYKRHQSAPGIKITGKAFGIGRRFPIINHFQEV